MTDYNYRLQKLSNPHSSASIDSKRVRFYAGSTTSAGRQAGRQAGTLFYLHTCDGAEIATCELALMMPSIDMLGGECMVKDFQLLGT